MNICEAITQVMFLHKHNVIIYQCEHSITDTLYVFTLTYSSDKYLKSYAVPEMSNDYHHKNKRIYYMWVYMINRLLVYNVIITLFW